MFDPNEFLNGQVEGSNDTKFTNPPDNMSGDPYTGIASKVEIRQWQGKADPSKSGLALDIQWEIQDESVKTFCGRATVNVKQGLMLDITDSGQLDMGKGRTIALGKLREALGMNTPGQPFSFSMIQGRIAGLFVGHRDNEKDPESPFAEVRKVVKL